MQNYINFNEDIGKTKTVEVAMCCYAQDRRDDKYYPINGINTEEIDVETLTVLQPFQLVEITKEELMINPATYTICPSRTVLHLLFEFKPREIEIKAFNDIFHWLQFTLDIRNVKDEVRSFFDKVFKYHPNTQYHVTATQYIKKDIMNSSPTYPWSRYQKELPSVIS